MEYLIPSIIGLGAITLALCIFALIGHVYHIVISAESTFSDSVFVGFIFVSMCALSLLIVHSIGQLLMAALSL